MFEEIVRPFERPSVIATGQRIPAVVVKLSIGIVEASWGETGGLPAPQPTGIAFTVQKETWSETDRTTEDVPITDQNDSSNQVVFRRAKTLTFDKAGDPGSSSSGYSAGAFIGPGLDPFSIAGDGFSPSDGSGGPSSHSTVTFNLNNNTTQGP
jgi:hypothetical protein